MNNQNEIAEIEAQIATIKEQTQALVEAFNQYVQDSQKQERQILEDAGLLDEVLALGKERQDKQAEAQAEADQLNSESQKLAAVLEYLQGKKPEEPPVVEAAPAPEPAPEPTPEPVREKTSRFLPRLGRG